DKSIQAVALATPHTQHRAQVEAIAAAGKHLYCEKPFALSKADAEAALDACRRAGIVIAVGHHFRLMPSMRVLAELKEAGAFGTVMHAEGNYSHDWLANYPSDIAIFGENCRAESVSETRAIVRHAGKEPEVVDRPTDNHLGRNLDHFAKAAMGQGKFPIPPDGILQTTAALEAVFKSVDANGAWMIVWRSLKPDICGLDHIAPPVDFLKHIFGRALD